MLEKEKRETMTVDIREREKGITGGMGRDMIEESER